MVLLLVMMLTVAMTRRSLLVTAADEKNNAVPSMKLRYSYEALEPFVDAETMKVHFEKHYQGAYVEKTNVALRGLATASDTPRRIRDLAAEALARGELQEELVTLAMRHIVASNRGGVSDSTTKQLAMLRNNGGGYLNHRDYFENMAPPEAERRKRVPTPGSALARALESRFGTFDNFKKSFSDEALGVFGSGWTWLVRAEARLEIITTPNQDRPDFDRYIPLLALDVWEHSYYLLHRNRRADYVDNFWKVVDFSKAEEIFELSERIDEKKRAEL